MEIKKILVISVLMVISLFIFSGCSSDNNTSNSANNINSNTQNNVVPNGNSNTATSSVNNSTYEVGSQIITDNDTVQIGDMV